MSKRGNLDIPIVGVAKAGWNLDQLRARARESVEKHGGLDREAFDRMCRLLRYVDGDYHDTSTFQTTPQGTRFRGSGRHTTSPSRLRCSDW